jgi:hypothetical protein
MSSLLHDERGGVVAKLLVFIVVLAVLAGGVLYVYAKQQRPLALDGTHAVSDGQQAPKTVRFAPGVTIAVATVVRNAGRLPVTLEGLDVEAPSNDDPMVPVSLGLGDGRTTTASTDTFTPPSLNPGAGIGVVITFGVNPNLSCTRFGSHAATLPLPPVQLRFSSYGVESVQPVPLDKGAPTIEGITRDRCEAAVS